jgi:hypothetical protein
VGAERVRIDGFGHLEDGLRDASPWYLWGPYLSERQWGTVREDYSEFGTAWDYFPHDHARSPRRRVHAWRRESATTSPACRLRQHPGDAAGPLSGPLHRPRQEAAARRAVVRV